MLSACSSVPEFECMSRTLSVSSNLVVITDRRETHALAHPVVTGSLPGKYVRL